MSELSLVEISSDGMLHSIMHLTLLTDKESHCICIFAWKIYRIIGIGQDSRDLLGAKCICVDANYFSI
jgi:hypothetical protein